MFEEVPSLSPIGFFRIEGLMQEADRLTHCKKPYLLPNTDDLLKEDQFAEVSIAWNEKALLFLIQVDAPVEQSFFPDVTKGDSIELFIDTRDLKSAGSMHRFCHHFVFFPDPDMPPCEITRLRAEEMREMADPEDLMATTHRKNKNYTMDIVISRDALYGYDPHDFGRLGFTYRINRYGGRPQHFAVASHEYALEKHPALWASLTYVN